VALILLARILVLVLALVIVAILKVLIAILTMIVFILTLVVFTIGVQAKVPPNVFSIDRALPLGTRMLLCWFGLFEALLVLLTLFLRILRLLVFALVGFSNLLLPSAIRAVAFCRSVT